MLGISQNIFSQKNIYLLTGNVLQNKIWRKIKEWLEIINQPGFNAIFCAPGGISDLFPHQNKYYAFVLEQMRRILNPDGDIIFTQFYFNSKEDNANVLFKNIKRIYGIDILEGKHSLRITRHTTSPENLFPEIK